MKTNKLSTYFNGYGYKRLTTVEIDGSISNQHEFNGVQPFKELFGFEKKVFSAHFMFLADEEVHSVFDDGHLTWYDSRERHPTRSEYRLYYTSNSATDEAQENDLLIVAKISDIDKLLIIIAKSGTTIEKQLKWLFKIPELDNNRFSVKSLKPEELENLDYINKIILQNIGIETFDEEFNILEDVLKKFNGTLPSTKIFSQYIIDIYKNDYDAVIEPDQTLIFLWEKEYNLFLSIEKREVDNKLKEGFKDVDDFINFSLKINNRRKSRAGYAFEHHLHHIFVSNNLKLSLKARTENKSEPDFIFPGIDQYHDPHFDADKLIMLGVKTTCKDRWRQILSEADRIRTKHLATLEPAISEYQTDEMQSQNVKLVVPEHIHQSYTEKQQNYIMSLKNFIAFVKEKQKNGYH